ncbi:MAG: hypothetical protein K2X53_01395 [Alphaproteobacteria bacterium]|nr:hypothetical protein [Alphaproteobacteria bacterium]
MKYVISAILFFLAQQNLFASVTSSSSSERHYLVDGDMEGFLNDKRQFIKKIVDQVKEIKAAPLEKRDNTPWYSDVEWSLNKASNLSVGRLGRLEVLQVPYLEWVHATFEYGFLEQKPSVNTTDVMPDPRRKVLNERLGELEGILIKALKDQMETKLTDIHFVSPITIKSQIENQMAFVMDYVENDAPLPFKAFEAPEFVVDCTPCTQKNMTLKPLLQLMGEDLLKLRKIQMEFELVYAKLGINDFNVHKLSPTIRAHIPTLITIQEHYLEAKNYKAEEFPAIKAKLVEAAKNKVLAESAIATTLRYVDKPEGETTVPLAETLVRNYCLAQWSEHLLGGVSMLSETLVDQGTLCPAGAGGRFFKDSLHFTVLLLEDFLA